MSTKSIQSKMKSVKSIGKITKTMEMVSVAKMRRASARAHQGKPYQIRAKALLDMLPGSMYSHPYYDVRSGAKTHIVVLIGSDKGMCGGYNVQLTRALLDLVSVTEARDEVIEVYAIGRYAEKIVRRCGGNITASFGSLSETFDANEASFITGMIAKRYREDENVASVIILSQALERGSMLSVELTELLPLARHNFARDPEVDKIKMEPHPRRLIEVIVPGLVESLIIQSLLEARAAEHTSRMIAMKNATDNATSYYQELTRSYNKARQAAITQEIAEIVGGAASLE
jgi:F-type H+-transporting ATPase subunit gamma